MILCGRPKNLSPLLPYFKKYRWGFVLGGFCVLLNNGIWILFPLVIRQAIDGLNQGVTPHKLLIYALGRGVEAQDMPAVRRIVREAADGDYKMSAIILGVVRSVPFRMRATLAADAPPTQTARVE